MQQNDGTSPQQVSKDGTASEMGNGRRPRSTLTNLLVVCLFRCSAVPSDVSSWRARIMSSKTSAPPAPSTVSDPQSREQFLESLRLRQTAAEARLNALRSDDPAEAAAALDDEDEEEGEGEDRKRDDEESEESSGSESGSGSDSDSSDAEEGEYENEVSRRNEGNMRPLQLVLASASSLRIAPHAD